MAQGDLRGFSNCMCCAFQPCEVVLFVLCAELYICFAFSFPPSLVDLVSIGLASVSTDLVSVTH